VLELLEEGDWTTEGITAEIAVRLDVSPNAGFLPLALEELRNAGLLDETVAPATPLVDVNRRELVRKLAMTGAAALLVPTVATLTATRGYAQGSPGALGPGRPCDANSQCMSSVCCNGICSNTNRPQAPGAACTANNQCSIRCCAGTYQSTAGTANDRPCSVTPPTNNVNVVDCACASGICRTNGSDTRCVAS